MRLKLPVEAEKPLVTQHPHLRHPAPQPITSESKIEQSRPVEGESFVEIAGENHINIEIVLRSQLFTVDCIV
jgi:hypothetical protein